MTAIDASRPPARVTNRLRMTRSRTLSSAPPMMMTEPSLTGSVLLLAYSRQDTRRGGPLSPCENPLAMTDDAPTPELHPVPGTARGRGRIVVDLLETLDRPTRRRAGVFRRALRREASRLRDPHHIAAVIILSLIFSLLAAGMIARGEPAGADARAYWAGVRIWINGGDPYHPTGPFLPYVYAPWMLPLFAPWALLPWDVAWFAWRGATILLLLWTIHWAYRRRPLQTALIIAALSFPFGANLDTGNINLGLTLMLWGAQFTGPRVGGAMWALATWMKWIPAIHWFILPPTTRRWGLVWLAISIALSIALLPLTIIQFQALFGFGARPIRLDYLVFLWAFVPWLYGRERPFALALARRRIGGLRGLLGLADQAGPGSASSGPS